MVSVALDKFFHREEITSMKVEIYSSAQCGYCDMAKQLLQRKGIAFEEIRVDTDADRRTEMLARANGQRTVPQIFIDDVHVGGCDQLVALDRNNQLDALLSENK